MLVGCELIIDTVKVKFVLLYVGSEINLISEVKTVNTFANGLGQTDCFKLWWYRFPLLVVIFCLVVFFALRHGFSVFFKNAFFEIYNSKLYNNICHTKNINNPSYMIRLLFQILIQFYYLSWRQHHRNLKVPVRALLMMRWRFWLFFFWYHSVQVCQFWL